MSHHAEIGDDILAHRSGHSKFNAAHPEGLALKNGLHTFPIGGLELTDSLAERRIPVGAQEKSLIQIPLGEFRAPEVCTADALKPSGYFPKKGHKIMIATHDSGYNLIRKR
jgi:hypothetical protein